MNVTMVPKRFRLLFLLLFDEAACPPYLHPEGGVEFLELSAARPFG